MNTSRTPINGNRRSGYWFRRGHRWIGVSLLFFVILLAVTGITLNHGDKLGLDRRFVSWSWVLNAYGIEMPSQLTSYADAGHRATLVGERLFIDGRDVDQRVSTLAGFVALGPMLLAAGENAVHLLTPGGDLVEVIELVGLPGPIDRVGRIGGQAVVQSAGSLLRSDDDIAVFTPWHDVATAEIQWSVSTPPTASELAVLELAYRGRGLTVERVLLDLHSGRILALPGTLLMDIVGVFLIVLGMSGLVISRSRNRRENGARNDKESGS